MNDSAVKEHQLFQGTQVQSSQRPVTPVQGIQSLSYGKMKTVLGTMAGVGIKHVPYRWLLSSPSWIPLHGGPFSSLRVGPSLVVMVISTDIFQPCQVGPGQQ